jgi:RNA polymerase sigma factor (sigma-70 family)
MDSVMPMEKTEAGASEAFSDLLERHRAIVFKVANTYSRHPARSFTTWMYRVALNVGIDFVRGHARLQRHTVPLDEDLHDMADAHPTDHESAQLLRLLQGFVDRQPPLDRALLLLYLDERPQREIAEILGISETNVSTKIGRLKQRIRDEL